MSHATTIPAPAACSSRARGTPSRKGAGPFYFPDGKARFNVAPYTPPAEDVDAEYPVILTTGRVVSHFLSGTQTRRIGPLVDQYPEPRIEMHPQLAEKLGIADGDWTTVESRRGDVHAARQVVTTIRPDTVFVPYHWAGPKSINQLTIAAQDPISKIPEYKVCAVRRQQSRWDRPNTPVDSNRNSRAGSCRQTPCRSPNHREFFIDPGRCIGCQACVQACTECDTHKGHSMIHLEYVDRAHSPQTVPVVCMHCDTPTCAEVCPADAIKRTADGVVQTARKPRCIACNNCVLACPFGVPEDEDRVRTDDEVRHVLRPHVGRQEADVRDRLPEPGAVFRHARRDRTLRQRRGRSTSFSFGDQVDSHEGHT